MHLLLSSCRKTTWKLLLLLLLLPATLLAQTGKELDTRLANSRQLLDQGKYALAMAELKPVLSSQAKYKDMPQALYLYAVAALKAQQLQEASDKVGALLQQYPNWSQKEEALFLSANLALEQKDYAKGLSLLGEVKSASFDADKAAMEQAYLSRVNDKALLSGLLRQFPDDKALALVYADKLMAGWYSPADKNTLEELVRRFDLDKKKYAARAVAQKKGKYKVAVLLPFPLEDMEEKNLRKNQLFTDLYTGMLLARDSLAKQQIELNLFAYEAPADTNKVKAVLNLPEMASMDLIIGPVYKSAAKIISRFASQHEIVAINPLSEDASLVKNNPYQYLFRASLLTQAGKAANFAYDHFPVKSAVVVYSNSPDYIQYAQAYKAAFEKRGGKVLAMKPVSPTSTGAGLYANLDFSALGHLMVASNNVSVAYSTISNLERQTQKIPLITYASWLEMPQISLKQLDDQEVYFLNPWFVDSSQETVRAFKKDYVARFQVPPSEYVYAGFDLMYYFGNILARHGAAFHTALGNEGPISGAFLQGIGYAGQHDNQYVPLLKLDNLQLNVVNPVFK
ncbi:MAG: ABC transporter substrate-binding protein [Adhaeribacter sp.]